jgi:hypothetical protein
VCSDAKVTTKADASLLENDPDLLTYMKEISNRVSNRVEFKIGSRVIMVQVPHLVLVNTCTTIKPYLNFQKLLSEQLPSLPTIVYVGNGISFSHFGLTTFSKGQSLPEFLQHLKDTVDISSLVIFAGKMVECGLSITSKDFEWDITEERLIVSNKASVPDLIQKCRIFGVKANPTIPRSLYMTSEAYKALALGQDLIDDLIDQMEKAKIEDPVESRLCSEFFRENLVYVGKTISRPHMQEPRTMPISYTDAEVGRPLAVSLGLQLPDDGYFLRRGQFPPTLGKRRDFQEERSVIRREFSVYVEEQRDDEVELVVAEDSAPISLQLKCVFIPDNLTLQSKDTYDKIMDYLAEFYVSGWIQRAAICKWMV